MIVSRRRLFSSGPFPSCSPCSPGYRLHQYAAGARWTVLALLCLAASAVGACHDSSSTGPTPTTTTTTVPATGAAVTLAPSILAFPLQTTGDPSPPQTSTLTNSGTEDLVITSVVASGSFMETDDCVTTLPPGAACTISVVFVPLIIGSSGGVTITDNASTSPQTLTLTGPVVIPPSHNLAPLSLTFPNQRVGTTSGSQVVTLSSPINGLSAPLMITSITVEGDFIITGNSCGSSLVAGASCTIAVAFTPTAAGTRTGLLAVFDNAANSQRGVTLTGVGQ
jgi:hypothetical protein